jgi:putative Mn2+ efflux pump MntP
MTWLEIILISIAMSFDAFAVSLAAAASGFADQPGAIFRLAFHFGFFQFGMPILGWLGGSALAPIIGPFDHWLAFGLLVWVAYRMLRPKGVESFSSQPDPSRGLTLIVLAIATSIDALAIGLSLAFLEVSIWGPSLSIGVVTTCSSLSAIQIGRGLHLRFGRRAEIIGGLILIAIALRIVIEHELMGIS